MQKGSILWLIIGNYDRENYDIVISEEGFNCIVSVSGEISVTGDTFSLSQRNKEQLLTLQKLLYEDGLYMANHIFPFLWMRGEEESILREELSKIRECGISAVCVEARPHDDFCGPGWWHDMDIVLDEARQHDMKVWILDDKHFPTGYANGGIEKHPERKKLYLACSTSDIFGRKGKHTLDISRMLKPSIGYWDIGKPADYAERANNRLYAILALRFTEGDVFSEDVLDLTDTYDGERFSNFELPEGQWRIHVLYTTRTDGGADNYINMIDAESAHTQIEGVYEAHFEKYGDLFGSVIAGFFSDEPQFGNINAVNFWDTQVGRCRMQLPWSAELEENLCSLYNGKNELARHLPFLFAESSERLLRIKIRQDYMDQVSLLYKKNFSDAIGRWCEEHHVEYIGHVVEDNGLHARLGMGAAHYFRAMSGQHMAGIDDIGGQYFYGAANLRRKGMTDTDGEFFHHALGKLGPSEGHLDPKKKGRTMAELFGAYGWSFGVRDMKYLLEHFLAKGVNHLVPHAFSMAEYPDIDCPPHFYARGNNPEFPYFAQLMKYAERMCTLLSDGQHVPSCAVLYDAEGDWNGDNLPMQKICRILDENQIDYDIVPIDYLAHPEQVPCEVRDGKLYLNGMCFEALICGYAPAIPQALADFISRNPRFPVFYTPQLPWKVVTDKGVSSLELKSCRVVSEAELPQALEEAGIAKIRIEPSFSDLTVYHYRKGRQIFVLLNESANTACRGQVLLPTAEKLCVYDGWTDRYLELNEQEILLPDDPAKMGSASAACVSLDLAPGSMLVLVEQKEQKTEDVYVPYERQIDGLTYIDLSERWEVSRVRAKDYPRFPEPEHVQTLVSISDEDPTFAGVIRYEKTVTLDKAPKKAVLCAEHVYDVMKLNINGMQVQYCLAPPYQIPVNGLLREGENRICIEVATTPARDQLRIPQPPFDFQYDAMDPTGMFGKVGLWI